MSALRPEAVGREHARGGGLNDRDAWGQQQRLQEDAPRCGEGFRAHNCSDESAERPHRASFTACQNRYRADRVGQEEPRRPERVVRLLCPADTPRPANDLLYRNVSKVLKEEPIRKRLEEMSAAPGENSPAEFAKQIDLEIKWKDVVAATGLQPE